MLVAAAQLAQDLQGISCNVLDMRTLLPWDVEAVAASVSKTGRLVVSHEAPLTGEAQPCPQASLALGSGPG